MKTEKTCSDISGPGITMLRKWMIAICLFSASSFLQAQFSLGIEFFDNTSYPMNVCSTTPKNGFVGWNGGSGYSIGDNLNVTVNWGDGTSDNYPTNEIIPSGSFATINSFAVEHIYTSSGIYSITIEAEDNHSNSFYNNAAVAIMSNCAFIDGSVRLDDDDGVYEPMEDAIAAGAPITVTTPSTIYSTTMVNTNAEYNISGIDHTLSSYQITIDPTWLTNNGFTIIEPATGYYELTSGPMSGTDYNFLLDCSGTNLGDASVLANAVNFVPSSTMGTMNISVNSFSCSGAYGDIDLTVAFSPLFSFNSTNLTSYIVSGNTFTAHLPTVDHSQMVQLNLNIPPGTPTGTIGYCNSHIEVNNYVDSDPGNNNYNETITILYPFDPNHKTTNLPQNIPAGIQDEIFYDIHFQNIGSGPAVNVTIVDTIDPELDLSTLQIVSQSHLMQYSLDMSNRIIVFSYPNINLPPQSVSDPLSQGFVTYKIKENPGLPVGSVLNNTAYIYFDTNPAVITNTTSNINSSLGMENLVESTCTIYPQPASEIVYLSGIDPGQVISTRIMNNAGQLLQLNMGNNINEGISVNSLASGMYFITIETKQGYFTKKLCIKR